MDKDGGIGVAYNVSSTTVNPSVRYTGRLPGDHRWACSTRARPTSSSGVGSQTHSASRWGDYSNVSVDPVDGCTFWATLEYMPSTSSARLAHAHRGVQAAGLWEHNNTDAADRLLTALRHAVEHDERRADLAGLDR